MNRLIPSIEAYSFGAWAREPCPSPVETHGNLRYSSKAKAGIVPPLEGQTSGSFPFACTASTASFGTSNLTFAVRSSWSHADGSNVFASVLTIAVSAFVGGTTSSQMPSIAGRWSSSTNVLRAWSRRHTGEPIHTAFELWISLSIGPPARGFPRDQTVRYRHPLTPR